MTIANDAARAGRELAPWVERLARVGYGSKGVVYAVIGLMAFAAAIGSGGATTDSSGAFRKILEQPFGAVLLFGVGIGLLGYAAWRVIQATIDAEGKGGDPKGIAVRTWQFSRGVVHSLLAWEAIRLAMGSSSGEADSTRHWTARAMSESWGIWLVGSAGVAIGAYGLGQIVRAWTANLDRRLRLDGLAARHRTWVTRFSRYGLAARGVVFVIIGWFLIRAARQQDSSEARGVGGALSELSQAPFGPWLLAIVAVGLVSYGLYELVKARYKRIDVVAH